MQYTKVYFLVVRLIVLLRNEIGNIFHPSDNSSSLIRLSETFVKVILV